MTVANIPNSILNISNNYKSERIAANNRQIASLEKQIVAQREVSTVIREMIANNTDSINITKELISNNEKQITNNTYSIDLTKQIISNNEKLIGTYKEQRGLLQESRDLTKESRDLTKEMMNIFQQVIELVSNNPHEFKSSDLDAFLNMPTIVALKKNSDELVTLKLKDYPPSIHSALKAKIDFVVDHSLIEIKNNKAVNDLPQRIDTTLSKLSTTAKFNLYGSFNRPITIYHHNYYNSLYLNDN